VFGIPADQRPVMLGGAFEGLPGQVEPVELGIAPFKPGQYAQRVIVVREATIGRHLGIKRLFTGMTERGVAEIVRQCQCLGQILVEPERAGNRAGNLRHFEAVGQARAIVIALVINENLRLVLEPAECGRMDYAVAIALERRAHRMLRLRVKPATALLRLCRKRRAGDRPNHVLNPARRKIPFTF